MSPADETAVLPPDGARAANSAMRAFRTLVAERTGRNLPDYHTLQSFALEAPDTFWALWIESSGIAFAGNRVPAITGQGIEHATFFPDLRLNYAENLLAGEDSAPAVSSYDESGLCSRLTRHELRQRVRAVASLLRSHGVRQGDRVAGIVRNSSESVIACLGAVAIGAIWSSVATDFGTEAILSRFRQLEPTVLVANGTTRLQGALKDLRERVTEVARALPSLRLILALDEAALDLVTDVQSVPLPPAATGDGEDFERFGFNHPLFILFSSGTTGLPKCIVHGAGGTLVEHLKELRLHSDLRAGDRLCFQTSAGWMMWNWQLSALASGCEIVLYDGSVSHPEQDSLLRVVDQAHVTVFGTNPSYIRFLEESGITPSRIAPFAELRAILSTGSVLPAEAYSWCTERWKRVPIQSISGGTDIIGCFVLGNPELPVHFGESQCTSLGYDVRVMTVTGPVPIGRGELVCCAPFPSRPLGFFGDPEGRRFHEAYFAANPGYWTHGDLLELTDHGTARVLGRTDGTLNIRGVRIGPAEVCGIAMTIPGVRQAMALEQQAPREPGGSRMVLLLVMAEAVALDRALQLRIKRELATRASMNHVPAVIADVQELPTTFSGKHSEAAARDAANGVAVRNEAAIRNPAALEAIRVHPSLRVTGV